MYFTAQRANPFAEMRWETTLTMYIVVKHFASVCSWLVEEVFIFFLKFQTVQNNEENKTLSLKKCIML